MSGRGDSVAGFDWKRTLRVAALLLAGTVGIMSRWASLPRWAIALVALSVPAVWIVTGFEHTRHGETERQQRQRMRNIAIALALAGLVLLFYIATMVHLGGNVMNRPI